MSFRNRRNTMYLRSDKVLTHNEAENAFILVSPASSTATITLPKLDPEADNGYMLEVKRSSDSYSVYVKADSSNSMDVGLDLILSQDKDVAQLVYIGKKDGTTVNTWQTKVISVPSTEVEDLFVLNQDFMGPAGSTLDTPWYKTATGSATGDFKADMANGVYELATPSAAGAATSRIDFNDHNIIDLSLQPRIKIRAKIDYSASNFQSGDNIILGLASDYNATFDNIARNIWFRFKGNNNTEQLDLLAEADDANTPGALDVSHDTGINIVEDAWFEVEIDCSDLSDVKFYYNGSLISMATVDMSNATDNELQPVIALQRATGSLVHKVYIDYVQIQSSRD